MSDCIQQKSEISEHASKACIFCKVVKGELPSNKVYEDEKVIAFLDIGPVNKGHTLVIPKTHCEDIFDISEEDLKQVAAVSKKVAKALMKAVKADGISIGQSNKEDAGQAVFHYHMHIMPRFKEDGLNLWPQGSYAEGEAKKIAEKIREEI